MKHVFNTSEVAHIWANQSQDNGRNARGNFYFSGKTIYSYGGHFPIATIEGNDVLFTMRSYSNTTAKHIRNVRQAISHKNIIYCYDVPTSIKYASSEDENNLNRWKREIKAIFDELGNKRIRDTQSRVNTIQSHINKLQAYCKYFKLTVKDKELKNLLKLAQTDNFIESARLAKDKANEAEKNKSKLAAKAYGKYLGLWRNDDSEGIKAIPYKQKSLIDWYRNNQYAFTHLRYNKEHNRLETSKGVQIPVEIAKRAFKQLNGCIEGTCKDISVPVLSYTITETTADYIKAGCHTIPKTDITYIAKLLNWN
jgi:hypothetical protein